MNRVLIVSAADDRYIGLLEGLLSSIGSGRLQKYDLAIIDLGLSDRGKEQIKTYKADAKFVEAKWCRNFRGRDKAPEYKKIFTMKPFIPDLTPGYAGYIWIDADIWFQDSSAIDDYIDAARETGAAFSFEASPSYRGQQKLRTLNVFGTVVIRGIKDYFLSMTCRMFSSEVAAANGINPVLNSGIFYMDADSPIWKTWQDTLSSANLTRQHRSTQICDQTCLQVSLLRRAHSYTTMPAIYNWLPAFSVPVVEAETHTLLDPTYPYLPIKALHLVASKTAVFELPVTDGQRIRTKLEYNDFLKLKIK